MDNAITMLQFKYIVLPRNIYTLSGATLQSPIPRYEKKITYHTKFPWCLPALLQYHSHGALWAKMHSGKQWQLIYYLHDQIYTIKRLAGWLTGKQTDKQTDRQTYRQIGT